MTNALHSLDIDRSWFEDQLLARFTRYVEVFTTSDRHATGTPSTPGQFDLARMLVRELEELGVTDVYFDDKCYVIARVPATGGKEDAPSVGFMAHLDTAPDSPGRNVTPRIHRNYDGSAVTLSGNIVLDPDEYPALTQYVGDTIITTDGTTLLGGDDKAGVAEIMTLVAYLREHPEVSHGPIEIVFTPDEEIGRGMDNFPLQELRSKVCYTVDGGEEGTFEAECFSAFMVSVHVTGRVIHPGTARGKLANAVTMAGEFLGMLPRSESPEATDGRYGFYCPIEVTGGMGQARVDLILRDFETAEVERRLEAVRAFAAALERAYPGSSVTVEHQEQYRNMRDIIEKTPETTQLLEDAIRATGMEPERNPIRGGTDGARLTQMGVPTPNIFAGPHNMHGVYEWVPLRAMVRAAKTLINLSVLWGDR
ncbi:MAG: peptidase T [Spirochaetaceae bacterium]